MTRAWGIRWVLCDTEVTSMKTIICVCPAAIKRSSTAAAKRSLHSRHKRHCVNGKASSTRKPFDHLDIDLHLCSTFKSTCKQLVVHLHFACSCHFLSITSSKRGGECLSTMATCVWLHRIQLSSCAVGRDSGIGSGASGWWVFSANVSVSAIFIEHFSSTQNWDRNYAWNCLGEDGQWQVGRVASLRLNKNERKVAAAMHSLHEGRQWRISHSTDVDTGITFLLIHTMIHTMICTMIHTIILILYDSFSFNLQLRKHRTFPRAPQGNPLASVWPSGWSLRLWTSTTHLRPFGRNFKHLMIP